MLSVRLCYSDDSQVSRHVQNAKSDVRSNNTLARLLSVQLMELDIYFVVMNMILVIKEWVFIDECA